MLLCDIGNTSYHFYNTQTKKSYKKSVKTFDPSTINEKIYYICVHHPTCKKLQKLQNWINLEDFVQRHLYYDTMGIDRIIACEAIQNGVIVDAGSAITIDFVQNGIFQGGFIYPGKKAFEDALSRISPALTTSLDFSVNFQKLPKNTHDALSYGFLSGLKKEIESYNSDIILTGGDAKELQQVFETAMVDELLLFKGMIELLKKNSL
ncbi:MAG: type III pantothenate kinase [Epsilonproteobacteria bacterium]|nr:type III pantothenate kinase [Campylobacterota bacterium]